MRYLIIGFTIFLLRFYLPPQLPSMQLLTTGRIASIAEHQPHSLQFIFITDQSQHRLWVNWYAPPPVNISIGDHWELALQIKSTNKNWLLAQGINGIATVQMNYKNQILGRNHWQYPIDHCRELIYQRLQQSLSNNSGLGFISALSIGMRDKITTNQWQDLRGTGTNHLMAIAGLHIGFVVAMFYNLINFYWRRFPLLMLRIPAQEAGTIAALIAALFYSALAGFALPTQRAIIMLSVFLLAKLSRRNIGLWTNWWIALSIILAYEPLAVLTPSFWLSFTAVALLIYGNAARVQASGWWWHWGRAQWVMAIGLVPLSLLFFQQVSLISFIANFIAIPFVGFIILPLCLLGDATTLGLFWKIAAYLLMHFWPLMHWLANFPHSQWQQAVPHDWLIFSTFIGVLLLLAPRGWPARWLGIIWLLPLIFYS
jgi:competence protein ComEC